ncbi:MAG TPA: tetratricopeptide repeat protein [Gemmatimonadota bacterium]|nr:tetratricopeptide repeat protein [Gemmatimonadota bacterium]
MSGYSTRDVARILDLAPAKVRRYARSRFLEPRRGPRNRYLFSFQDLVLLRTAVELERARIPARRVHRALRDLRQQLPVNRPLTAIRIAAEGDRVVVHDGATLWSPDSGQVHFDFSVSEIADRVASLPARPAPISTSQGREPTATEWFELGLEHEPSSPQLAQQLYGRALELDPDHADALVNLGCLLHEADRLEEARSHYTRALESNPAHATAAFNLGVALEDMGRPEAAYDAYSRAVAADPALADAHFNLSRLCETTGDRAAALRHLRSYREITRTS